MGIISKYASDHVDPKIIFVLDFMISLMSSFVVVLLLNFLARTDYYSGSFALWWLGGSVVFSMVMMIVCKSYNVVVRYATFRDFRQNILVILVTKVLLTVLIALTCTLNVAIVVAVIVDFLLTVFLTLGVRFLMVDFYTLFKMKMKDVVRKQRILVFGTSDEAIAVVTRLGSSKRYHVLGFVSRESGHRNLKLVGCPVVTCQTEEEFKSMVERYSLYAILFISDAHVKAERDGYVKYCVDNDVKILISPTIDEMVGGDNKKGIVRGVEIEDLLGRPEITISKNKIKKGFCEKVVMVTGAAGSIGSELCRQLANFEVKRLVLFDNAETPMHNLRLELEARFPELDFVPVMGDVRHLESLDYVFRTWHPQVVFHAAAYKHVPLMEENPCEAVLSNVYGSRIVADKSVEYGVEMMVMISTDKAVNPTNIMGCSKRLAEIYVQSLGLAIAKGEVVGKTGFVTTRFGNVLGSNGSVILRFREQIENGGPVTVTHPDITRFFMTIPEACRLVMEAAIMGLNNKIFVFDMGEPVRIADLAQKMIELAGLRAGEDIEIEYTRLRPGEKLYEEVLAEQENTESTLHDKIRIAKVREYGYSDACKAVDELTLLSRSCQIADLVKLMKRIVPEFKSHNSEYQEYDK